MVPDTPNTSGPTAVIVQQPCSPAGIVGSGLSGGSAVQPPARAAATFFRPRQAEDEFSLRLAWNAVGHWWKAALPAGLVLAGLAAAAVGAMFTSKYEATAWLRIDQRPDYFAFEVRTEDRTRTAMQNQVELLRSPLVLDPVVKDPEIAWLPEILRESDPARWLAETLVLKALGESELLKVSLATSSPASAARLVNAVVDSYLKTYGHDESGRIRRVVELLETEREQRARQLKALREQVQELTERVAPHKVLSVAERPESAALQSVADLQRRLISIAVDEAVLRARLRVAEEAASRQPAEASQWAVEKAVAENAEVQRLRLLLFSKQSRIEEIAVRSTMGENDPLCRQLLAERRREEQALEQLRDEIRQRVKGEMQSDAENKRQAELASMRAELEGLRAAEQLLREHCEAQIKDGQPTGGSLLELTSKLAELARAEKVFELLSERVLKLQTEERAPLGVSLLKRAEVPTSPAEASPLRKMGLAALAALCLPFVLATFWERFVGRVSEPNQLQRETRVSVVGEVAELPDHRAHNGASLSRRTLGKLQVFEESVDGLRTALLLSDDLRELRVIAVTSAASHEGKTSLAVSLALSVARASGQPTLLVDGDLRAPSVHRLFDAPLEPGLAEVLRGERRLEEAIVPAADGAVHVLPAGKLTASPHALLGSGPLAAVLRELSARYRYVIIDTPPILGGAEALLLAKIADGCLLCALRNSSRGDEVRKACEQLATAGTRLIGAVLNGVPSRRYDYRKGPYYGAGTPCG